MASYKKDSSWPITPPFQRKEKYTKLKKSDGLLTDLPEEQVQNQSNFFGKEIFGRNTPYD